jgi:hypothetical protein
VALSRRGRNEAILQDVLGNEPTVERILNVEIATEARMEEARFVASSVPSAINAGKLGGRPKKERG